MPTEATAREVLLSYTVTQSELVSQALRGYAIYIAITGGLLKFTLDSEATPELWSALVILGGGLSAVVFLASIIGLRTGVTLGTEAALLSEKLGLEANPASFAAFRYLASLIAVFTFLVLIGWIYIFLSHIGLTNTQ